MKLKFEPAWPADWVVERQEEFMQYAVFVPIRPGHFGHFYVADNFLYYSTWTEGYEDEAVEITRTKQEVEERFSAMVRYILAKLK